MNNLPQIYLDYNATTPCSDEVISAMLPFFKDNFGNASSSHHHYGWRAKQALDDGTLEIAESLNIAVKEIIYTSGSTESINAIFKSVFEAYRPKKNHIITSKAEHKAVLDVCKFLEQKGADITYLDVDQRGLVSIEDLKSELTDSTLMVALMVANNETGVIQPLDEIAALCKQKEVFLFSDATQALGKIHLDHFFELVDFACFSGHKIYGPKGIGFCYIKETHQKHLEAFIHGGGQQRGLRGGTYNTPGIVGVSKAVTESLCKQKEESNRLLHLRDKLKNGLSQIDEITVNGESADRLPNTLNVSFHYVDGENLLRALSSSIAVSNGSACNSAAVKPSHVLTAMGVAPEIAMASIRFSLGKYTTPEDIDKTIKIVTEQVASLREENILWERRNN